MDKNELEKRLENIKERIKRAAEKNKRDIDSISLVAVSKRHSLEKINLFADQGIHLFGESRVQELTDKYAKRPDLNWHFIGHLQRNKVKYLMRMENCKLIHSLDSWRLAKEINKRAKKNNRIMPLLLQVNVADEDSKYGITVEKANDFLTKAEKLENINIIGLMTMAPHLSDSEEVRPVFRKLAQLKNDMNKNGFQLSELSMGMSNDFEVAIEEGSTMVRIGSALFGSRR